MSLPMQIRLHRRAKLIATPHEILFNSSWMAERQAASFVVDESTGRSMNLPFSNTAPARTRATRCGALTARQRASAASISLNAIASPGRPRARPLGDLAPQTHCRESRFDGVRRAQMGPMLRRVVVERRQHVGVVDDLRGGLREL